MLLELENGYKIAVGKSKDKLKEKQPYDLTLYNADNNIIYEGEDLTYDGLNQIVEDHGLKHW